MLDFLELDRNKFAPPVKSGLMIGYVREDLAENLYLRKDVAIISGGHDQCCAVLGSGLEGSSGSAMLGMGTFICLATVFSGLPGIESFYLTKMPVEHHVRYGSYISFIYNQSGGAMIDWFLRNFYSNGNETGIHKNSHQAMFDEVPESLNDILVIPRFGATGPPDFLNGNKGCISGLSLNHSRGDILRAMLEGINFYMLDLFEKFPVAFREIDTLIATGGGSVSEKWLRITSDVLNKVIIRNTVTEASSLGAAILAGKGSNMFTSYSGAIGAMVHKALQIEPDPSKKDFYREKFGRYKNFVS
jgi:xylulokinase